MRMLGRYQVPGCCPGTRAGRTPGPDCAAGGPMDARRAKRIEQRQAAREITEERMDIEDIVYCPDCVAYWDANPYLTAACASVGIEYGKSTAQMLREHLAANHERGHRENR